MKLQELLAAYPCCIHAIAFCELHFSPFEDDARELWSDARELGPTRTIAVVRELLQELVEEGIRGQYVEALDETHHPSFAVYLRGRLGCT